MPARPAPPNVLPIELAAFRRLRSQGRRSFRSTPTSCCRRAARVERSGQPNKLAWRAWPHGVAQTVAPIGPGRAVDQGGSARDVGLGGGSVEDLGMNASTLERIRFAAANRLCVDVGYEGDVQRVEPYSLRKARGGNVVLYACEAGSSECATYRTGGISEVEVTRQTFVPKYANELLSPGR